MATRSLYQPHEGHTVWGTLAFPHRGQVLRAGAASFQLALRRLLPLAFDVFFLGTAICCFFSVDSDGDGCWRRLLGL